MWPICWLLTRMMICFDFTQLILRYVEELLWRLGKRPHKYGSPILAASKPTVTWTVCIRITCVSLTLRVENMTIVNNVANTADNVDRMQDVIKIRRGAKLPSPMHWLRYRWSYRPGWYERTAKVQETSNPAFISPIHWVSQGWNRTAGIEYICRIGRIQVQMLLCSAGQAIIYQHSDEGEANGSFPYFSGTDWNCTVMVTKTV